MQKFHEIDEPPREPKLKGFAVAASLPSIAGREASIHACGERKVLEKYWYSKVTSLFYSKISFILHTATIFSSICCFRLILLEQHVDIYIETLGGGGAAQLQK